MADDTRIDAGGSAYRGFLFADMRGFTEFAERHGNAAAAAMVSRFLEIARRAIARCDGAEIKTEGDAIHAVFPAASSAVLCGLEIVDAADELNARQPNRTLGLGVGVHAGEAVQTAEGYIGRAVNIAARLCAAAKPGEVLVSSTVKGITQSSIPVGFIPKGNKRLKGIADPVMVYAVTRDANVRLSRPMASPAKLGAAGTALVGVVAIAILAGSRLFSGPGPGASPTAGSDATPIGTVAPRVQPVVIGPLGVGTYATQRFQPPFTFTIRDLGWTANSDMPELFGVIRDANPRGGVEFLRIKSIIESPCVQGGEGVQTGPAGVIRELQGRTDYLTVSEPQTVSVGGETGEQVDVTVSDGALAACGGLAGGDVALFDLGQDTWRAAPGERFRLISINVGNQEVTIIMSIDWTTVPSVQELESLLTVGQRILDSVEL